MIVKPAHESLYSMRCSTTPLRVASFFVASFSFFFSSRAALLVQRYLSNAASFVFSTALLV